MTHIDKGNYAAKHPAAKNLSAPVMQAILAAAHNSAISCAAAHKIARDCKISPKDIGRAIDKAEVQITHCQLGIFKHSADRSPSSAKVEMTPGLKNALTDLMVNERLSCEAAWSIAKRFDLTKRQIGAACDQLGIKVNTCQLGTFG